jgi:hypothetical protein
MSARSTTSQGTAVQTVNLRSKSVKNIYDLYQVKKMIGKQLVVPYTNVGTTGLNKKLAQEESKKIKDNIMSMSKSKTTRVANLSLIGFVSSGVIYVISGLERYFAINSITYNEIKTSRYLESIEVHITQYPKLSKAELAALLNKLGVG